MTVSPADSPSPSPSPGSGPVQWIRRVLAGDRTMPSRLMLQPPSLVGLRAEIAALLEMLQQQGLVRASLDAASTALALETVVLSHITELAASGTSPEASYYYERWQAVVGLVEAALEPGPPRRDAGLSTPTGTPG